MMNVPQNSPDSRLKSVESNKIKEKLTLEDCVKYPNAKLSGSKNLLNGYNWEILERLCNEDFPFASLENCKLILRPLSDLTEEEKKYVSENFYDKANDLKWEQYLKTTADCINYYHSINIYLGDLPEGTYILEPRKAVAE